MTSPGVRNITHHISNAKTRMGFFENLESATMGGALIAFAILFIIIAAIIYSAGKDKKGMPWGILGLLTGGAGIYLLRESKHKTGQGA